MSGPLLDPAPRGPGALKHLPPLWVPPWVPEILRPEAEREIRRWHQKREADIAALIHRIESGTSRIALKDGWNDPRPTSVPRGDAKAEEAYAKKLREEGLQLFKDLAHTEAGFKLLSDLDKSPYAIQIAYKESGKNETSYTATNLADAYIRLDGKPSKGSGATIGYNARLTSFVGPGETEQPWMTERTKYGFYHELVHAWHGVQGTVARGDHKKQAMAEFQAVGLGPFATGPISENTIRQQMGKPPRPDVERVTF
jgi:NleD-like pathogen effector protein (putative zinc metallopeptidase)